MHHRKGGAGSTAIDPTPVEHPRTPDQGSLRHSYVTTRDGICPVSRTNSRRWTHRPTFAAVARDVIVWTAWFLIVAAIILAVSGALWVAS